MVALHREHFGRGPGAAKTYISGDRVVCIRTDIYTPVEALIGRSVLAFLSVVHFEPDVAAEVFILAPQGGPSSQDGYRPPEETAEA